MPILIENIAAVVIVLVLLVLLGNGILIALTFVRRQRREKYFQRIDELRQRLLPVINRVLDGSMDYHEGRALLEGISGLDRDYVLEQLLMAREPQPSEAPTLRRLCEDLGLVKVWQRHVAGRFDVARLREAVARPEGVLQWIGRLRFLLRARSAKHLGTIRHQPSWPLLVEALNDSHPDVQVVAIRALGEIAEAESFAALVERMSEAVLDPHSRLSLRSVRAALVRFPLQQAAALLPSLQHAQARIRFLATDVIREMVEPRAAQEEEFTLGPPLFASQLAETFLTRLCFDENPDVRARAAPVIAHLEDPRATAVLLTLLEDTQWFVRLHTVRALAKRKYLPQVPQIILRLGDSHWMVREATARALLVFGRAGLDQLGDHFLNTRDRYSREQIADEIQRAGLIPALLAEYSHQERSQEGRMIARLAEMGKTSYMLSILQTNPDRNLRRKFLRDFGQSADPQIRAWVKQLVTQEADPELRALAQASVNRGNPRGGA